MIGYVIGLLSGFIALSAIACCKASSEASRAEKQMLG